MTGQEVLEEVQRILDVKQPSCKASLLHEEDSCAAIMLSESIFFEVLAVIYEKTGDECMLIDEHIGDGGILELWISK